MAYRWGDQHDNAARVVARKAGVRLPAEATPDQLRSAIGRVMTHERFKQGALELGRVMAFEDDATQRAANEIEFALRKDDDDDMPTDSENVCLSG